MPAAPLTVAAVQLSSQDDVARNLAVAARRIEEAAARGARLVLLPENFAYFGETAGRRDAAERIAEGWGERGPIVSALAEAARRHRVFVIGGGMPERSGDDAKPFNTCVVVDPGGRVAARYRKIHLFDVDIADGARYRESDSTSPGDGAVVVDVDGWKIGLSVCYDIRFPELYRALSSQGADAFVIPAAFTLTTGKDHWHVLLRARAIEGQAYVIAAAQWGKHPRGRQTYGKSLVADPWGEVIAQCSEGDGIAIATLDAAYLAQVRESLPSLRHRRL